MNNLEKTIQVTKYRYKVLNFIDIYNDSNSVSSIAVSSHVNFVGWQNIDLCHLLIHLSLKTMWYFITIALQPSAISSYCLPQQFIIQGCSVRKCNHPSTATKEKLEPQRQRQSSMIGLKTQQHDTTYSLHCWRRSWHRRRLRSLWKHVVIKFPFRNAQN